MGPWYPTAVHGRFEHVFSQGELVTVDRIGSRESGLVVARKVSFDGADDYPLMARARLVWDQLKERATLFG
jgi:hypothetical protein